MKLFFKTLTSSAIVSMLAACSMPGWLTFRDDYFHYQFQYPPGSYEVSGAAHTLYLPTAAATNLDLKEMWVDNVVGIVPCTSPIANDYSLVSGHTTVTDTMSFNGIDWLVESATESASGGGTSTQWIAYSTSNGTVCVSLVFLLRYTASVTMLHPLPEFNRDAETRVFLKIVDTFEWLVTISPSPSLTAIPTYLTTANARPAKTSTPYTTPTSQPRVGSAGVATPGSTPTPGAPHVSVSVETNCRSGPGSAYAILGILKVGETAEVVGRSVFNDNWIIKLPSDPSITCWLWGQYATVTGDASGLKAWNPPPTPTSLVASVPTAGSIPPASSASFDAILSSIVACDTYIIINFQITNTGSIPWESIHITVTDTGTGFTGTNEDDNAFVAFLSCNSPSSEPNLGIGQSVYTSAVYHNPVPPPESLMTADIRVCSQDNLAGDCQEKGFTFSP